ncbi:hypothetical protein KJ633_04030 [bacterium]|nr:hypothetical protein [bacterium]MBU3955608.1 hypothetical protein [bacterium]MBU4134322.1 hypothetical protein [bacterium]
MAWQELLDSIEERMRGELDEIVNIAEDKKKRIIAAAAASAARAEEEGKKKSLHAAQLLHDEIISAGRISSKNILRKSHLSEIDAVYGEFKKQLLNSADLKKKILLNFIEKNADEGCEVELSSESYALLKGEHFSKKIKLTKKNTDCPVFINMDKIVMSFEWDEFLASFRAATIKKVSKGVRS